MEGKDECVHSEVILTANHYMLSEIHEEIFYAVEVIMMCSIHLKGKNQCLNHNDDLLIKRLISLLSTGDNVLRKNVKQVFYNHFFVNSLKTLKNIADLPKGFLIIVRLLNHEKNLIEEVYNNFIVYNI